MLQIGAALFYYKLGQILLQIGTASLLQIGASAATNWRSYYKLGQPLLQNKAAITNRGKICYKLRQVVQIRAIITNWSITKVSRIFVTLSQLSCLPALLGTCLKVSNQCCIGSTQLYILPRSNK